MFFLSIPYISFVGNIENRKVVLDQCLKTSYNAIARQILTAADLRGFKCLIKTSEG